MTKKIVSATVSVICFLLLFLSPITAQQDRELTKDEVWDKIKYTFTPPNQYKNEMGSYKNPLLFNNGDSVKNAADWERRRKEMKQTWDTLLGEWPTVLTNNNLEVIDSVSIEDFKRYTVRFYWTPTEQTTGYLSIPNKEGKKPAVITVFYEPETAVGIGGKPYRDFAYQLTKRGFVTLSLGTTEATKEQTYALFYPDIDHATVQPLSMLGYAAANAWEVVARLNDVDSTRIGITGHSFGGKWAMFGACLYDKFACAAWSDPGIVFDETLEAVNYWEPYYLGYHPRPWRKRSMLSNDNPAKGLYVELVKSGYDLHELHALMAPRPFHVSGGTSDPPRRWIPLNHSIAVNKVLGYENRVSMDNRPTHDPTEHSNEMIYSFFEYFLK